MYQNPPPVLKDVRNLIFREVNQNLVGYGKKRKQGKLYITLIKKFYINKIYKSKLTYSHKSFLNNITCCIVQFVFLKFLLKIIFLTCKLFNKTKYTSDSNILICRFSSIIKTRGIRLSLAKKQKLREDLKRVKEISREIKAKKQAEKEAKKQRRRENLKRADENRKKSEIVQVVSKNIIVYKL